ncbi:MAG: hypothetical protein P4N41_19450 [Negativicutes bacterium]|nr:hypothetical protein [Negativicutes bacterium]MDR3591837.1 hypothetical protein [Negativicutes bacterium]
MGDIRQLTETGLLAAFIFLTGAIKVPGLVPGTEFQLSAPLAVAICTVFGFRRYITAGVIASIIGLVLGTQNFVSLFIAMVFRLTVGGALAVGGTTWPVIVVAGPVGSMAARLVLGVVIGDAAIALVMAAVPGMIYTALTAWPLTLVMKRVKNQTERVLTSALQR